MLGFSAQWFFRMEVRLGRLADSQGGGAGDGAHEVHPPPRLLTVVRERCSAGRVRDDGWGFGRSSGCGCAGSLKLLWFFVGLGKSLGVTVAGVSLGLMGPLCTWYHSRIVAILRFVALAMRQGRRWGGGFVLELDRP